MSPRKIFVSLIVMSLSLASAPPLGAQTEDPGILYATKFAEDFDASELATVSLDGSGSEDITANNVSDSMPALSPDGCVTAYSSGQNATYTDLYLRDMETGTETHLLPDENQEITPAWSSDGQHIVVSRDRKKTELIDFDLVVVTTDGEIVDRLTRTKAMETNPVWSPDGRTIIFERESRLFTIDLRTEKVAKFARGRFAEWSPDGDRVVFSRLNKNGDSDLFIARQDGSKRRRITWGPTEDQYSTWSLDGSSIAFTRSPDGSRFLESDVYLLDLVSEKLTQLTDDDRGDGFVEWAPRCDRN